MRAFTDLEQRGVCVSQHVNRVAFDLNTTHATIEALRYAWYHFLAIFVSE